jgi:ferredoxin-NADP reductase
VDGPHSAPSEHYVRYSTVMVIGAGIGMTPCASILSALLR